MSTRREPALDGFRGLAALAVFFAHAQAVLGRPWTTVVGAFVVNASLGVDVFFVLSGFLITRGLLEHEQRGSERALERFWARRIRRIVPLYLAYLALVHLLALVPGLFSAAAFHPTTLVWVSLLVPLSLGPDQGGLFMPIWSLTVEEHFYLAWPLVVLRSQRAERAAMIGIAFAMLLRAFVSVVGAGALYFATPTRMDALLIGALAACAYRKEIMTPRQASAALPFATFMVAGIGTSSVRTIDAQYPAWTVVSGTLFAAAVAIVILATLDADSPIACALSARPLAAAGRVSYGLYLLHSLVGLFVGRAVPKFVPLEVAMVPWVGATYAVAHLSYEYFERPILLTGSRGASSTTASYR